MTLLFRPAAVVPAGALASGPLRSAQADIHAFRQALAQANVPTEPLTSHHPGRVLRDLCMDWALILLAWYAVITWSLWLAPLAVILIGNRQRALGNLLHDASHYLLSGHTRLNDAIGQWWIALPSLASLYRYRSTHFQHHAKLGSRANDPDYYAHHVFQVGSNDAVAVFLRMVWNRRHWLGDGFGDLLGASWHVRLQIVAWWGVAWMVLGAISTPADANVFLALWFTSRLTVFHAITSFRELCDHTGMTPGGVFAYTRNVIGNGWLRQLIHPHNNGYHLVHHLMPTIPYHRLAIAHQQFSTVPMYRQQACHCTGYFAGEQPAVNCWIKRGYHHE